MNISENESTKGTIIGGLITTGLFGLAGYFLAKTKKEIDESERLLAKSRELRKQHEDFMRSIVSQQEEMAAMAEPFGEKLDEFQRWIEEQEKLIDKSGKES